MGHITKEIYIYMRFICETNIVDGTWVYVFPLVFEFYYRQFHHRGSMFYCSVFPLWKSMFSINCFRFMSEWEFHHRNGLRGAAAILPPPQIQIQIQIQIPPQKIQIKIQIQMKASVLWASESFIIAMVYEELLQSERALWHQLYSAICVFVFSVLYIFVFCISLWHQPC